MNSPSANRRRQIAISNICRLSVAVFAVLFGCLSSASAAMMTSEESTTSALVLSEIEGGGSLGGLSVWFDIGLADPNVPTNTGASSRVANRQSDTQFGRCLDSVEKQLVLTLLPNMDFCVFTSSSNAGSPSGVGSTGFGNGHGGSALTAILEPQLRLPARVSNHFWRGTDFVFVPPIVPDELLRPPQI